MKKLLLLFLLISFLFIKNVSALTLSTQYKPSSEVFPDIVRIKVENWLGWRMELTGNNYYTYYLAQNSNENRLSVVVCLSKEKNTSNFNQKPRIYCDSYYFGWFAKTQPRTFGYSIYNDKVNEETYINTSDFTFSNFYTNMYDYKIPYEFELHPDVNVSVGDVTVNPSESSGSGSFDFSELKPYLMLIAFCSILVFISTMWKRRSYL